METPLSIEDAKHLMEVLENDIPSYEKKEIAFLLLILASNTDLVNNGKSAVGYSPRSHSNIHHAGWEYGGGAVYTEGEEDYYSYGC